MVSSQVPNSGDKSDERFITMMHILESFSYLGMFVMVLFYGIMIREFFRLKRAKIARCVILQTGNGHGRTHLCFAGYGQSAGAFQYLIDQKAFSSHDQVLYIPRRANELSTTEFYPISWITLGKQISETIRIIKELMEAGDVPKEFSVIGHSAGAVMAQAVAAHFPGHVNAVTLLCPPPHQRFSLLRNWTFWKNGGLRALFPAFVALFLPWRGFTPNAKIVRGLFTGPRIGRETLLLFKSELVAESTLTFLGLLFTYRGKYLALAKNRGYRATVSYIICPSDAIFKAEEQKFSALMQPTGQVFELSEDTPHCFWLESHPAKFNHNIEVIRQALRLFTPAEPNNEFDVNLDIAGHSNTTDETNVISLRRRPPQRH